MKTKLLFTVSLLVLSRVAFGQPGLLGSYPFNGNANDVSGNGNNGIVNNAVLTNDRFGNPNSAYFFNGINSYINLGNNFSYVTHSFSCWARRDSAAGNTLVSKINNGTYDLQNSEYSINTFTTGDASAWFTLNSTVSPNYAQWNCYVATFDAATNEMKLYVNGVADSMIAGNYADAPNTPVFIGARPYWNVSGGPAFFFVGAIDEVNIYGTVLTQHDVDSLCSATGGIHSLSSSEGLAIFPNPFSMQTIIQIPNPLRNVTLTVSNCLGEIVRRINGLNGGTFTFYRDNLPMGIYIFRMVQDNQLLMTKKLVITN